MTIPRVSAHRRTTPRVVMLCCAVACGGADAVAPPAAPVTPVTGAPSAPEGPAPAAVDTGPLPGGRLAFSYEPAGSSRRVYAVRFDGTGLTALSPADQWAYQPTWSPDGSRVAYVRSLQGDTPAEIWVVRGDGTGATHVATGGHSPFWLDDARVGYGCAAGVCAVGADGAQPRTLLARQLPDDTFDDSFRLSPDGTTLVFVRHVTTVFEVSLSHVWFAKLDGTLERPLARNAFDQQSRPAWSPDGKHVAYLAGPLTIVVDVDGGPPSPVVLPDGDIPRGFMSSGPAWSPSGSQIVFGLDPRVFYVGNADGSGALRRVTVPMPATERSWAYDSWSWTSN